MAFLFRPFPPQASIKTTWKDISDDRCPFRIFMAGQAHVKGIDNVWDMLYTEHGALHAM